MPNSAITEEARLSVRISREIKNRLGRAAAIRGQTLSDFIVTNLLPVAEEVIQEHQTVVVSERDYGAMIDALNNPPRPNNALLNAAKDYKKAILAGDIIVQD
jgi:uncharacterized protein (DUF1778 family)